MASGCKRQRKDDGLPEREHRQFAGVGAFGFGRHGRLASIPDHSMIERMSLDERDFFNSKNETRTDKLTCPRCKRVNEYQMRWVVNTKKDRLPPAPTSATARCTPSCATTWCAWTTR